MMNMRARADWQWSWATQGEVNTMRAHKRETRAGERRRRHPDERTHRQRLALFAREGVDDAGGALQPAAADESEQVGRVRRGRRRLGAHLEKQVRPANRKRRKTHTIRR